jgi:HEAT repeat protein
VTSRAARLLSIAILAPCCASGPKYQGKPLSAWVEQLADRNSGTQQEAISALADAGEESVPFLVAALDSIDRYARYGAARGLNEILLRGQAGSSEEPAFEAMAGALANPDPDVRAVAIDCMGSLGARAAPAVEPLAALLADHTGSIRLQAAIALNEIGTTSARAAIPVTLLIDALLIDDGTAYPPAYAAQAPRVLGSLGPRAVVAVPALSRALEYNDPDCRRDAAWALGRIGPSASKALPALEKARDANRAALTMDADFDRVITDAIEKIRAK